MVIINGQVLAEKIKDDIVKKIVKIGDARPNLAVILIGEREDSMLYVNLKEKEAKKIGIDMHTYKCPSNIPEQEVLEIIDCLNKDELIDAILVQLPLPSGFDADKIIKSIDPAKDVDRFHPDNLRTLLKTCDHNHVIPPVFNVVLAMLKNINCDLAGKRVCVIANSDIFGKSLAKVLECRQAKCVIMNPDDQDLLNKTNQADILISAAGRKRFIKKNLIKKDAVIIDIGITREGKKIYGDADFADVKKKAGYITPVPGGVGPMTIAMLFKNTLELYEMRRE